MLNWPVFIDGRDTKSEAFARRPFAILDDADDDHRRLRRRRCSWTTTMMAQDVDDHAP
jgi:hypothetical protein